MNVFLNPTVFVPNHDSAELHLSAFVYMNV